MEKRRQFKYRLAQSRGSLNTSPVSCNWTAMRRDPQLYESERVQPTADDRIPPIFIDLDAARKNKSSFLYDSGKYSTNTKGDDNCCECGSCDCGDCGFNFDD